MRSGEIQGLHDDLLQGCVTMVAPDYGGVVRDGFLDCAAELCPTEPSTCALSLGIRYQT